MSNPLLKEKIVNGELIFSTGVWDEISALILEQAGFDALHLASMQFSGSMGLPDFGLISPKDVREKIAAITERVTAPLIVDFESGYGGLINAAYWAKQFEKAGATAIHIDDYGEIDKCPWLPPYLPNLEKAEATADKIKAICDSRASDNFMVIARSGAPYSSAYKNVEEGLEEGIRRLKLWKDAGADIFWGRAFSVDGLKKFREDLDGPLCTQVGIPKQRDGKGAGVDGLTVGQLFDIGYQLIFSGVTLFPVVLKTMLDIGTEYRTTGDINVLIDKAMPADKWQELIGLDKLMALRNKYETRSS